VLTGAASMDGGFSDLDRVDKVPKLQNLVLADAPAQ
jgi:hypothetical protein